MMMPVPERSMPSPSAELVDVVWWTWLLLTVEFSAHPREMLRLPGLWWTWLPSMSPPFMRNVTMPPLVPDEGPLEPQFVISLLRISTPMRSTPSPQQLMPHSAEPVTLKPCTTT